MRENTPGFSDWLDNRGYLAFREDWTSMEVFTTIQVFVEMLGKKNYTYAFERFDMPLPPGFMERKKWQIWLWTFEEAADIWRWAYENGWFTKLEESHEPATE